MTSALVRDLGPRIAHQLLPLPGKGGINWGYSWISIVGPLIGAALAALLWVALGSSRTFDAFVGLEWNSRGSALSPLTGIVPGPWLIYRM